MIDIEISSIFHEIFLIISYVSAGISSIIIGRKNNIHPAITMLILFISTLFYLLFFNYFVSHSGNWYHVLQAGFPHIDKSFGLAGVIFGLIFSGLLLRIPLSVLYKFSFPILIIYSISNLGCLGGHCREVHAGLFNSHDYINFLASFRIGYVLKSGLLADPFRITILFKIIAGCISTALLYQFLNKFRNPMNIFFMVLSSLFLISFVNQFFIYPASSYTVFNRLLGLNIFQWALLLVTFLVLIHVYIDESNRRHRFPKLRIKSPANYKILMLYAFLLITVFRDSSFITKTNPSIFIIGFSFTTLLLVLYFRKKIRLSALRYAVILIILVSGSFFLQTSFFTPQNSNQDFLITAPEKKLDNRNVSIGEEVLHSYPIEKERFQFVKSHQLGHESLTLSPIHSFADRVLDKYTDHSLEKPAIRVIDQ